MVDASAAAAIRDAQQAAEAARKASDAVAAAKPEPNADETPNTEPTNAPPQDLDAVAADEEIAENLERAAADLAAKAQQLEREQALALALAELAKSQQESVEQLADARDALKAPTGDQANGDQPEPADTPKADDAKPRDTPEAATDAAEEMSAEDKSAARKLAQAMKQFSDSQRLTGEGAVELSGQEEVANQPIREALDLASELLKVLKPASNPTGDQPQELASLDPAAQQPPAPADESEAPAAADPAEPGDQTNENGEPAASGEQPGENLAGQPQPGENGAQQPGSPQQGNPQSDELGTGFVPDSPEATARLMADPELLAQLSEMLKAAMAEAAQDDDAAAAQAAATEAGQPAATDPPTGQSPKPGQPPQNAQASQTSEGGGASDVGLPTENQETKDDALNVVDTATPSKDGRSKTSKDRSRNIEKRQFRQAAWFAKLPTELRNAILAGSQRRAPRAYEDRLRRYFESIE
jgi:hypothetical protein